MTNQKLNIGAFLRFIAFLVALFAMIIHPMINSLTFHDKSGYEFVDLDIQEDCSEKENQEEENKEEKIKLQFVSSRHHSIVLTKKASTFGKQYPKLEFTLRIHVPPPEWL